MSDLEHQNGIQTFESSIGDASGFNYLEEASRTVASKFYGETIDLAMFNIVLDEAIGHLQELDSIKKSFFYNKTPREYLINTTDREGCWDVIQCIDGNDKEKAIMLLHGIIGIATEAGELLEHLRDVINGDKRLDVVNLAEEIGDLQWYESIIARIAGVDFEHIQRTNINKLRKRYPDKFTESLAIDRDIDSERLVLEASHNA